MRTRTWSKHRAGIVAALVAVVSTCLIVDARAAGTGSHLCGAKDHQENGVQGDLPMGDRVEGPDGISEAEKGYNCGLALVGHTTLGTDGRTPDQNANMAWSQDCAYISGPGTTFGPTFYDPATDNPHGVAVVDVRNPKDPKHVKTLIGPSEGGPASTKTSETLFAIDVEANPAANRPERHLLVVGQYGNAGSGVMKPMDIYDVSAHGPYNCANPEYLMTYTWQENIHNLSISGNGKYVFATQPLQVIDIDPLFDGNPATDITYIGDIERDMGYPLVAANPGPDADDALPQPVREANRNGYSSHQAFPNYEGTKLYLGSQTPNYEVFTIVNLEPWLESRIPETFLHTVRPEILSQRYGRGHSVVVGNIAGQGTWALHSEESVFGQANDCNPAQQAALNVSPNYGLDPFVGVAEPFLSNVTDEHNPDMHVSRLGLEINQQDHCTEHQASGVQASVHYHDFDSAENTHFAIASMQNAGIRVFDVMDPHNPAEVAYFNPGDVFNPEDNPSTPDTNEAKDGKVTLDYAWAHSRYVPDKHQIWFATRAGGFWVIELEKDVVNHFVGEGHPGTQPLNQSGAPGTVGVFMTASLPAADIDPAYCTLGGPV